MGKDGPGALRKCRIDFVMKASYLVKANTGFVAALPSLSESRPSV